MDRSLQQLTALWRFRHFVLGEVAKEFRARFARSRLGALWIILHPLALVAVYALVLSAVLAAKLPGIDSPYAFAIYLTAGIFAWSLFADILTRCTRLFVEQGNVLKKVVFPRITLPIIVLGVALIDNLVLLLAILIIFGLLGHWPGGQILWLPLLLLLNMALALGLGLILGTLNVFIRDVGQVVPIALQFGFWLTPIVYTPDILPAALAALLAWSPLFPLVGAYQSVLVFNTAPEPAHLLALATLVTGLLALALILFRRASAEMVDLL
ncbi:lipopolysaccharide transport system permease protein [Ectothiorhodospira magna]|uniref:Transport permease protein n=1 Tax=Ectothiorhodospira magna TaxID=867345 RepID=A0A1H9BKG3_9GAMM|nr:ABC transporter permease [Ectothiorhodospira magna]SEP89452.1 lipopolysaccharide transport system permease protein [Ectothiorhodospira magna]